MRKLKKRKEKIRSKRILIHPVRKKPMKFPGYTKERRPTEINTNGRC